MKQHKLFCLLVSLTMMQACSSPEQLKRQTDKDAGPVSSRALNTMAETSPESLIKIASALEQGGNYGEALRVYTQAAAAKPDDIRAPIGQARLLIILKQKDQALSLLDTISKKQSLSAQGKQKLAELYMNAQAFDKALTLLEPASESDRQKLSGRDLSMIGILYELKGNGTKARTYFDLAQAQGGGNQGGFSKLLAYSFALDGNYETAVALLQPLLNAKDTQQEARVALAYIYALSGQAKVAMQVMESGAGYQYMKERQSLLTLLPHMNRQEKSEAILFGRVRTETLKRLKDKL